jgi:hypothetical protein
MQLIYKVVKNVGLKHLPFEDGAKQVANFIKLFFVRNLRFCVLIESV